MPTYLLIIDNDDGSELDRRLVEPGTDATDVLRWELLRYYTSHGYYCRAEFVTEEDQ